MEMDRLPHANILESTTVQDGKQNLFGVALDATKLFEVPNGM